MPIYEYERIHEICEVAEQFELYGIIAKRSVTPAEEYVSLTDALKQWGGGPEERAFMKAVLQGVADIEKGRIVSLVEAKKRLGQE